MAFDVLSFVLGQKAGKGSGGGSVEGVHFVTFMNEDGNTELYKRPVADGDDCADPVKRGLMDEPTKVSTAQYNYTHIGWSATPNGALDENILKNVTADKTVYANFAGVLRYYTITYYDSDGTTVLHTESLLYGATPSYAATKDGWFFNGWEPAISSVTADATYTAQWVEKLPFDSASWADIARISENGEAEIYFAVGDTKSIPLTFSDGTTRNMTFTIVGFNHDNLSDGSGKAGITIASPYTTYSEFSTIWNSTGAYYSSAQVRTMLNGDIKSALPAQLQSVIKQVNKPCDKSYQINDFTTRDVADYLWLFSMTEIGWGALTTGDLVVGNKIAALGTKYDGFTYEGSSKNHYFDNTWIRNMYHSTTYGMAPMYGKKNKTAASTSYSFGCANGNTAAGSLGITTARYVRFGFCI